MGDLGPDADTSLQLTDKMFRLSDKLQLALISTMPIKKIFIIQAAFNLELYTTLCPEVFRNHLMLRAAVILEPVGERITPGEHESD